MLINSPELPFEFIFLKHYSHDMFLKWDFLQATQPVIDFVEKELFEENICANLSAVDFWKQYLTSNISTILLLK